MSYSSKRRSFTPEYKAEVVRLCQQLGKSLRTVAVELGLTPSSVAAWVRQAEVDAAGGTASALATSKREGAGAGSCGESVRPTLTAGDSPARLSSGHLARAPATDFADRQQRT